MAALAAVGGRRVAALHNSGSLSSSVNGQRLSQARAVGSSRAFPRHQSPRLNCISSATPSHEGRCVEQKQRRNSKCFAAAAPRGIAAASSTPGAGLRRKAQTSTQVRGLPTTARANRDCLRSVVRSRVYSCYVRRLRYGAHDATTQTESQGFVRLWRLCGVVGTGQLYLCAMLRGLLVLCRRLEVTVATSTPLHRMYSSECLALYST